MAKRTIRLTESDMKRLVKKINEEMSNNSGYYEQLIDDKIQEFIQFLKDVRHEMSRDETISQEEKEDIENITDSIYSGLVDSTGMDFDDED